MKAWRESASIIIAAKNGLKITPSTYNYNLLFLKRQQNTKFAGSFVFPGGLIEPADADLKWEKLFSDHGFNETCFKSLYPSSKYRPEIFRKIQNEIPREISLRISAIRETFEECGILLCEKSDSKNHKPKTNNHLSISREELEVWQHKVHNNANEFYNMCKNYDCYPNIWTLYEWGNWLSPTFLPSSTRFDTAFFFTALPHIPESKFECQEIEELIWVTPDRVIESYLKSLLPPQQYEILRIFDYKNFDHLLEYAVNKSKDGVQRILPVRVLLSDGVVTVLPGDSMYPEEVDNYQEQSIDKSTMTIEQFYEISPKKNRIILLKFKDSKLSNKL